MSVLACLHSESVLGQAGQEANAIYVDVIGAE